MHILRSFRTGAPIAAALLGRRTTGRGGAESEPAETPAQPKATESAPAPEAAPKEQPSATGQAPASGQAPAAAQGSQLAQVDPQAQQQQVAAADPHAGHDHSADDGHGHRQPDPSANLLRGEMERNGRLEIDSPEHDFGQA